MRARARLLDEPLEALLHRSRWTRRGALWALGAVAFEAACHRSEPAPASVPSAAPPLPDHGARFDPFPIHRINSLLTPTNEFFVRDHFGIPPSALSASSQWVLSVEGDVEQPLQLGLGEVAAFGAVALPVTLECAGNAGHGLAARGPERAWSGASTGRFQGFSLAELIRRARPKPSVVEIVLEGADEGAEHGSTERNAFARSVPLEAALSPHAMLVTGMNGTSLPALHGGPLRAMFPGRYATDSVKWVRRIRAVSTPFEGFYQRQRYRRGSATNRAGTPLGPLKVQAEIGLPRIGDRLPQGLLVDVVGVAWGGEGGVARVEVSVDGGKTYAEATFLDPELPFCWRRWRWSWLPDASGPRQIMARAMDRRGIMQPVSSDDELGVSYSISGPDGIQYLNNSIPVVPVTVV